MAVENVINLESIKAYMMFTLHFESHEEEVSLEVGCGEDIEMQMEMYFKEQWSVLFTDWYDSFDFMYARFNGIKFINQDKHRIGMQIYGNYKLVNSRS